MDFPIKTSIYRWFSHGFPNLFHAGGEGHHLAARHQALGDMRYSRPGRGQVEKHTVHLRGQLEW